MSLVIGTLGVKATGPGSGSRPRPRKHCLTLLNPVSVHGEGLTGQDVRRPELSSDQAESVNRLLLLLKDLLPGFGFGHVGSAESCGNRRV